MPAPEVDPAESIADPVPRPRGQATVAGDATPQSFSETAVGQGRARRGRDAGRPGDRVGRFEIRSMLGRGGMGTVYEAYDARLERPIALKLLHPEIASRRQGRLRREAEGLAQLSHSNVVQIYDVGQVGDRLYLAMELVRGQTLRNWQRQPQPWRRCIDAYVQAGRGLAAAHAKRLVHRDFKPHNCIIDDTGRVRVLDFGLVCGPDTPPPDRESAEPDRPDPPLTAFEQQMTRTGAAVGTLAYMPLEQLEGQAADARSDQFSLCVSLFEAVYGQHPFEWSTPYDLAIALERGRVRPAPRGTRVPARLWRILARGLATDPAQRWPSMDALLDALRQLAARRPRRWYALTGIGVVGAMVWAGMMPTVPPPMCTGGPGRLVGTWDPSTQAGMLEGLEHAGPTRATDTAQRVRLQLDDYADRWTRAYTEACTETRVHHRQTQAHMDARMQCLEGRLSHLRGMVVALSTADAEVAQRAVQATRWLPAVEQCADPSYLQAQMPRPDDPAIAARVVLLQDELAEVSALTAAGMYKQAEPRALRVRDEAEALGFGPLRAEAALVMGVLQLKAGHYTHAVQSLTSAYFEAGRWGVGAVQAPAAVSLVELHGAHLADYAQAHRWERHAEADLQRLDDDALHATLATHMGGVLIKEGHYADAQAKFEQALLLWRDVDPARRSGAAQTHHDLATALELQGRYLEAEAAYRRALAIRVETVGAEHPSVGKTHVGLGAAMAARGQYAEALVEFRTGLSIYMQTLDPDHPSVATAHNNIGIALSLQGHEEQALAEFRTALAKRTKSLGPEHPDVAASHDNLGNQLRGLGRHDEALAAHRRALAISGAILEPSHPDLAYSHHNIAEVLRTQGRNEEALVEEQRAYSIWTESVGPRHPDLAHALLGLAADHLVLGRPQDAVRHAERGHALRVEHERGEVEINYARVVLARSLWAAGGDDQRARALAEQARSFYRGAGESAQGVLTMVEELLATNP